MPVQPHPLSSGGPRQGQGPGVTTPTRCPGPASPQQAAGRGGGKRRWTPAHHPRGGSHWKTNLRGCLSHPELKTSFSATEEKHPTQRSLESSAASGHARCGRRVPATVPAARRQPHAGPLPTAKRSTGQPSCRAVSTSGRPRPTESGAHHRTCSVWRRTTVPLLSAAQGRSFQGKGSTAKASNASTPAVRSTRGPTTPPLKPDVHTERTGRNTHPSAVPRDRGPAAQTPRRPREGQGLCRRQGRRWPTTSELAGSVRQLRGRQAGLGHARASPPKSPGAPRRTPSLTRPGRHAGVGPPALRT